MLRDQSAPLAEKFSASIFKDLWVARDAYIDVVLDRMPTSVDRFFAQHAVRELTHQEQIAALELMELERHTQLMYTSCGWFFDEVSGIETVQIIAYAGRVLQLAAKLFGEPGTALEQRFLEILSRAQSNLPEVGDAAELYRKYVLGIRTNLEQVAAHYAISSIFRLYPDDSELFSFEVHRDQYETLISGRAKVAFGCANIRSRITGEQEQVCFAVLHLGDQNLSAAVRGLCASDPGAIAAFSDFAVGVRSAMNHANLPEVIRLIDRYFGTLAYSLTSLFSDEQHRILRTILDRTVAEMEESLRKIYEDHTSLLRFLTESEMTAPPALALAANYAINSSLRRAIEAEAFDPTEIQRLLARSTADHVVLDTANLGFVAGQRMKRAMVQLESAMESDRAMKGTLQSALTIATMLQTLPFDVNLWQAQNIWNDLFRRADKEYWSPEWKLSFKKLGEALYISVDELVTEEGVPAF
jgi:hypothetical protein